MKKILIVLVIGLLSSCHEEPKPKLKVVKSDSVAFYTGKFFRTLKDAYKKGYNDTLDTQK